MAIISDISKEDIKMNATQIATEIERMMERWKYFANKLGTLTESDLTVLGLDANYQAYLGSLRVSLLNIELKYRNQSPLDASDPSYFVKLFSNLTAF